MNNVYVVMLKDPEDGRRRFLGVFGTKWRAQKEIELFQEENSFLDGKNGKMYTYDLTDYEIIETTVQY